MREEAPNPWYREPWPWILMAGPAVVVVAGAVTTALAIMTNDGLVTDDYYKQGLAINRTLAREAQARTLGLTATVQFNETGDRLRVTLEGGTLPEGAPRLRLLNATRPGLDQTVTLVAVAPGLYEGAVRPLAAGAWRLQLEDAARTWRLDGPWRGGAARARLEPAAP